MRRRHKVLLALLLLVALGISFRGPLFRATVTYHPIRERAVIRLVDPVVEHGIYSRMLRDKPADIQGQVDVALAETSYRLEFTTRLASADPNNFWPEESPANCVGYAATFCSLLCVELDSAGLSDRFEVRHNVGKLTFLGFHLHSLFRSPFFADHDYCTVRDRTTGETWHVDPTVHDHLRIRYITAR